LCICEFVDRDTEKLVHVRNHSYATITLVQDSVLK
jgi:hypothetical protein